MIRLSWLAASIFSTVLMGAQSQPTVAPHYAINVADSKVEFLVKWNLTNIKGTFGEWTGDFKVAMAGNPETATLLIQIASNSMTCGSATNDKILKGQDFFYVKKYPHITFRSTKVLTTDNPNRLQLQGEFTLRGVTKPVFVEITLDHDPTAGGHIFGNFSFNRREFGMIKNMPLNYVQDSVRVQFDLSLVREASSDHSLAVNRRYIQSFARVMARRASSRF